jgi:hypothetical protein
MAVVAERNGKRMFRHRQQLFGAAGGLVRIFDERNGTTASCDPVEFLMRAEALGLEAARCVFPSERTELENAANEMEQAAADAAAQGNPLDPKVQAYHARHRQKNMVLVGAGSAALAGDAGPKLWVPPGA